MIYKSTLGDIDISKATRVYPAVVVDMHGEQAEMSLEWIELYEGRVEVVHYVLVFDFTPLNEDVKNRKVLTFSTKEELISEIQEVAKYLN